MSSRFDILPVCQRLCLVRTTGNGQPWRQSPRRSINQKSPIGHLQRNSAVTLLAARPKAGFYHVQTADGTKGWVGVKYLTVEVQAGTQPTPNPTPGTTPTAGSSG